VSGVYGWRVTCLFTGAAAQLWSTQRDATQNLFVGVYEGTTQQDATQSFLWVYMNIHITQHKCLRSFVSHRRSPQDPVEVH